MTNHELDLAVAEAMGMEVGDLRDETSLGASVLVKQWYSEDGYILVDATRHGWSPSTDANLAIECAERVFGIAGVWWHLICNRHNRYTIFLVSIIINNSE